MIKQKKKKKVIKLKDLKFVYLFKFWLSWMSDIVENKATFLIIFIEM